MPCRCHLLHIKKQIHGRDMEIKESFKVFEAKRDYEK